MVLWASRALLKLLFCFCVLEQIGDEIIEELGDQREALVRTRDRVRTGCFGFFYHAALFAVQVSLFIHPILPPFERCPRYDHAEDEQFVQRALYDALGWFSFLNS